MLPRFAAAFLALALLGCGSDPDDKTDTASEVSNDALEADLAADSTPEEVQSCTPEMSYCDGAEAHSCVDGKWVDQTCGAKTFCNFGECWESRLNFPSDAAHHNNIIEWWYYTGHVSDGQRNFGFELALFQQDLEDLLGKPVPPKDRFGYMCHVALLDKDKGEHSYTQGIATKITDWSDDPIVMHILNCHVELSGDGNDHIVGTIPEGEEKKGLPGQWKFDLEVSPTKPVVHHGANGVIPMAEAGDSYYYSYTRLEAAGQIVTPEGEFQVEGQAWMDHQWGDFQTMHFKGWDWWSMQFEDGWEIMLFLFRDWDDVVVEKAGTLVDPDGNIIPLDGLNGFEITSLRTWASTETDGVYPLDWDITIEELDWDLKVRTGLDAQEMPNPAKNYWEGAVTITGTRGEVEVEGLGYVELTGYASDMMAPK